MPTTRSRSTTALLRVTVTGAQLERVLADQLPQLVDGRRGLFGVSGIRVAVTCDGAEPRVRVTRDTGKGVEPRTSR